MQFKASNRGASNPHIINLKGGESVTGVLRGEPIEYESAFRPGDKPKFQFQINMVVAENGALVAKILRGGWKLYHQLSELNNGGWDLEKHYIKVSRQGSSMNDTVYSATPLPTPVAPEKLALLAKIQLRTLSAPKTESATPVAEEPMPAEADCPF